MAKSAQQIEGFLKNLLEEQGAESIRARLQSDFSELPRKVPNNTQCNATALEKRRQLVGKEIDWAALSFDEEIPTFTGYAKNIENLIGTVKVPVGLAGPLRVNGLHAKGDHYCPLATTEAALVASYNRGCHAISEAGGCRAVLLSEGVTRSPGFAFSSMVDLGQFAAWAVEQRSVFGQVAEETSRFAKMVDMKLAIEGNHIYLQFEFTTGDAAGQNMVTIATQAICDYIAEHAPVDAKKAYVEANMSGDKKASMQSFQTVRGKKVSAEITIPKELVNRRLRTEAVDMVNYWQMSAIGGVMSGTLGVQGHFANGLAALFLATGQDIACVSEASVGITRMELTEEGDLYAAVTLPNLIVGTVGGGTALPSQAASLEILGLRGVGKAQAFSEVIASLCLAGELSIIAALSAGHFSKAHKKLARK